jgi:hypothetical protein
VKVTLLVVGTGQAIKLGQARISIRCGPTVALQMRL